MPTSGLTAALMSVVIVITPCLEPRPLQPLLRSCGEVEIGVVDAVEDVGEGDAGKSEADVDELRVAVAGGLDRGELGVTDGTARCRKRADEADERVALEVAGRLAGADVLDLVRLQTCELAEQAVRGLAIVAADHTGDDK